MTTAPCKGGLLGAHCRPAAGGQNQELVLPVSITPSPPPRISRKSQSEQEKAVKQRVHRKGRKCWLWGTVGMA